MLEQLCKAINEAYRNDPSFPGVTTAWLGTEWYVSVVRYHAKWVKTRKLSAMTITQTWQRPTRILLING